MVSSKLEELERETAMKAPKKGEEEEKVDFVGEKRFKAFDRGRQVKRSDPSDLRHVEDCFEGLGAGE
ncbi:hypothetical protein NC653_025191 [Populus alba x Populus x berolinensis]|uniref:Uncharacterized protein n=1 Tax=Populus alba x Populus x berolinensis TaxID=444605 RepID=A0AAD6MAN5_9ROSI|nr:hypothetical protein NC653_025191 [Populus alba x Populus x berolinensis]